VWFFQTNWFLKAGEKVSKLKQLPSKASSLLELVTWIFEHEILLK